MDVEVNYLAVLLAGLSSMVIGSIWYTPKLFGGPWMKMTGVKMNQKMSAGKQVWMFGSVFAASLVTAYVLAHVTFLSYKFFGGSFVWCAVQTAFWVWLGFTALRMYTHDTFEGRRKMLTLLNASHELVTLVAMALLIGWLQP